MSYVVETVFRDAARRDCVFKMRRHRQAEALGRRPWQEGESELTKRPQ